MLAFGNPKCFSNVRFPYLPSIYQWGHAFLYHASHERYQTVNGALNFRICGVDQPKIEVVDDALELVFLFVRGVGVDGLENVVACPAAHFLNVHICNSEVIGCACENVPMGADKACAFYSFLS